MGFVEDSQSGVLNRMLSTTVWRGALNVGTILYAAFSVVIQTVLIVLLALALGADFKGGVGGVLLMILVASLLAGVFASLSNAVGVLTRQRETVIGAVSFVQLPLTFLSAALMQRSLLPHWIQTVAKYNPVNWAAQAARDAAMEPIHWAAVLARIGLLAALLLLSAFLATRAFAAYQRSL
jgi:ABC-2 type transport system permease protein